MTPGHPNISGSNPSRWQWSSWTAISKRKTTSKTITAVDPDPPNIQKNINVVRQATLTANNNASFSLFGRLTRALKSRRWGKSSTGTSATTNKVEHSRSRMSTIQEIHPTLSENSAFSPQSIRFDAKARTNPLLFEDDKVIAEMQHKEALSNVRTNGMELAKLSPENKANEEIVKAAIRQNPLAFQFAEGKGLEVSMEALRKTPSLLFGEITKRKRDGTMESTIMPIPMSIKVKFALLFLSQEDKKKVQTDLLLSLP